MLSTQGSDMSRLTKRPKVRSKKRKKKTTNTAIRCPFCRGKVEEIDYKDVGVLTRFCSSQGKILSRKRTGVCASHQRGLSLAIRQTRVMALLPFVAV
jgi:small subunit ribosomal protein S18